MIAVLPIVFVCALIISLAVSVPIFKRRKARRQCHEMKRHLQHIGPAEWLEAAPYRKGIDRTPPASSNLLLRLDYGVLDLVIRLYLNNHEGAILSFEQEVWVVAPHRVRVRIDVLNKEV
jgi:hypothetical protein